MPFQMTKLEFEVARKSSRTSICECNQLTGQIDLCMCGCVHMPSHALNDKAWLSQPDIHLVSK